MTPSTTSFTDATLPIGQTFSDATYGINVTVLSATASALTVQVGTGGAAPPPAPTATTTSITATPNPSSAGTAVTMTATVSGAAPTGTVAFTDNGVAIAGCAAVSVTGSGNVRSAACVTSALAAGGHPVAARYSGDAGNTASTSATLTQTVNATSWTGSLNVALASNGGVASASSTYGSAYPVSALNNNVRSGAGWGAGGGWNDGTAGSFPDWVQITFNGQKTIDHVVVFTLQDNYATPVEPSNTMTFSKYGITAFQVQGWNGTAWITLGSVSGNNLVKRTVSFASFATDRIRVQVTGALASYSRITEIEAWTAASAATSSTNFALASNGGTAFASSTNGPGFMSRVGKVVRVASN